MIGLSQNSRQPVLPAAMRNRRRTAAAYVVAMLALAGLGGLMVSFVGLIASQSSAAALKRRSAHAYYIAEAGLNAAIAELNAGLDYDDDGPGAAAGDFGGGTYEIAAVENAPDDYTLTSVGTYGGTRRAIEAVVQRPSANLLLDALAAITSNGPVETTGNITVDGRDHSIDGLLTGAPGVFGVVGNDSVARRGSSEIGGNGVAPSKESNIFDDFHTWADGVDNDGDGATDEEPFDGVDNDGDGEIDEDVNSYPTGPDVALGLPPGILKAIAQMSGTYFATEGALNSCIAANGGNVPGGKILYLEADEWLPADFGTELNEEPSIFVMHNESGTSLLKNLHGQFKGLLLADHIVHINANAQVLGAVMSFGDELYGNDLGNGNADVKYSSEVLGSLPSNPAGDHFLLRSWREVASQ